MTNFVVVGSHALKYLGLNVTPKDLDAWYFGTPPEFKGDLKEMPQEVVEYVQSNYTLDTFYTIKLSHAGWDIKWEKTANDILALKYLGAKKDDWLYNKLVSVWKEKHGDKVRLSLKKSKKDFFTNGVVCHLDHDYLHEVVAYHKTPLYKTVLCTNEEVLVDKDKFFNLSPEDRIKMVREEIYVIALERFYIPLFGRIPTIIAYKKALKLVVTRLTKNWFCDYILDNLEQVWYLDKNHNFVEIFNARNISRDIESENYRRLKSKVEKAA